MNLMAKMMDRFFYYSFFIFRVFGQKYFNCPNKFGLFLRPDKIEVGDFPELELDDEI